jgi:2-keto-3-deoxy-L-rhamnonate aldolase RhmA
MNFLFITNSPEIAKFVSNNGVNLIFIDIEINGKLERQGHLDTVISRHTIEDISRIRSAVPKNSLLVRINPLHDNSAAEINAVIEGGADILMLPMFRMPHEVSTFISLVAGRARCCLLIETVGAIENLSYYLKQPGIDQIHIGLNDLHLELGLDFMFQPLANELLDEVCAQIRESGIPFGIGGVARIGEGALPADILLAEHVRLGSSWAILSRTFHRQALSVKEINAEMDFGSEIKKLRERYLECLTFDDFNLRQAHLQVQKNVEKIVSMIRSRNSTISKK